MNDNKKFIEQLSVDGWSVKTDTGFRKVTASNKTVPYHVCEIRTESYKLRGAEEHIVFNANNKKEVFLKDVGGEKCSWVLTETGPERVTGWTSIPRAYDIDHLKEHMYDLTVEGERYYTNGILSHNTTLAAYYLLYEACFPPAQGDILIVAHKQGHAMEVLKRLKDMYYSMPLWMKPGIEKNNETSVTFDNGMRVIAEATTANCARGKTLKFVYCTDGYTKISVRNKITKEIREIDIHDLWFDDEYK